MRGRFLSPGARDSIAAHGRRAYPEEACGFLVGKEVGGIDTRGIDRAIATENAAGVDRRRRFVIPAEELRTAEARLVGTGETVLGFYHSHPDGPGRPSALDEAAAWPGYTYVVIGVRAGRADEPGAFELDAITGRLDPAPLDGPAGIGVASGTSAPHSERVYGPRPNEGTA